MNMQARDYVSPLPANKKSKQIYIMTAFLPLLRSGDDTVGHLWQCWCHHIHVSKDLVQRLGFQYCAVRAIESVFTCQPVSLIT